VEVSFSTELLKYFMLCFMTIGCVWIFSPSPLKGQMLSQGEHGNSHDLPDVTAKTINRAKIETYSFLSA
jgi:hypothetical protein